jgi:membrane-associated phospholipid phosphatase
MGYQAVRGVAGGKTSVAFDHAQSVIDLERSTHTLFEPGLQQAFIHHDWIIDFANFMYLNSHFVVTTVFLTWLYFQRNETFYFVRNMFMIAMVLAILGYSVYPTAPPRLFPQDGFIDTVTDIAKVNHDTGLISEFVNPYAAIPSMHCGFSLMIGATGALVTRHTISRVLWCIYPALVFWVVVVTANHYWLDGLLGWMVACLSAAGALALARYRPASWSFHSVPQEA